MKIQKLLGKIATTDIDIEIQGLCLNASLVQSGEVFVALKGAKTHGIQFANQAIQNGCVAIFTDSKNCDFSVPCISISDLQKHLQSLAARLYPHASKVEIIGITGTNGKTSVGYFIHQLLTKLGCKNGFIGTLGITEIEVISRQTTPDILTLYKALNQYYLLDFHTVILEVSSHALAQNRVAGLNFKQAIFTNLSQDHLDYHQNFKSYQQAKIRLFEFASLKCKIVNSDDENHQVFLGQNGKIQVKYQLADFTKIAPREHGFLCQLDDFVFELPLLGEFNLSNILAAFSSIEQMGFAREAVIPLLPLLSAPIGRMQKIQNSLAWVDFAHTPDALKNAISTLKIHYPEHKIRVVFGCGGNRDQDKRAKMGKIASELASSIILTNDNPRDEPPSAIIDEILSGIDDSYPAEIIPDRQLAIETAITTLAENECLLIAGKGHESTQQFKDKIIQLNDIEIAENATLAQN